MVWNKEIDKIILQEMVAEGVRQGNNVAKGCCHDECTAKLRGKCKVCKRSI